jgi:DNA-binding transcriptional ArsR family regulator
MPPDLVDRILEEIRERKQASLAAHEESQRLQRVLAALESRGGRATTAAAQTAGRRGRLAARRQRRTAPGANREAIIAVVHERPGVTAGELTSATGIARATVSTTAARLVAGGALERIKLPGSGVGFRLARE